MAYVGGDDVDACPAAERGRRTLELFRLARRDNHLVIAGEQRSRDREPDSLRTAGDNGNHIDAIE